MCVCVCVCVCVCMCVCVYVCDVVLLYRFVRFVGLFVGDLLLLVFVSFFGCVFVFLVGFFVLLFWGFFWGGGFGGGGFGRVWVFFSISWHR